MKFKLTIYDDDEQMIGDRNIDVKSEEFVYEKLGEAGDSLAKMYMALDECEMCYSKVQEFSDKYPDKHICQKCVENMNQPLNQQCNE